MVMSIAKLDNGLQVHKRQRKFAGDFQAVKGAEWRGLTAHLRGYNNARQTKMKGKLAAKRHTARDGRRVLGG